MKYSIEKLVHFQCEAVNCKKWFSIGDAPLDRFYFCPWCGNQDSQTTVVEPLTMDDMDGDCKCEPNTELRRAEYGANINRDA